MTRIPDGTSRRSVWQAVRGRAEVICLTAMGGWLPAVVIFWAYVTWGDRHPLVTVLAIVVSCWPLLMVHWPDRLTPGLRRMNRTRA